jgi:nitroimidazol reductase NimA-like FMN-containing flavoprotein (pyridoxamine 5'-phosphate oxidase superfamily)
LGSIGAVIGLRPYPASLLAILLAMRPDVPDQIRVRRGPDKGRYGDDAVREVLERAWIAHVAFSDRGRPACVPMLYALRDQELLIHGSTASRAMRALASGSPACVAVTTLDAIVFARSAFEHSANYRSAVAYGTFEVVPDDDKVEALAAFTDKLLPGRWDAVRAPAAQELKATLVLALPLRLASVKTRVGPPDDDGTADADLDVWAGVLPVTTVFGEPLRSPGLRDEIRTPEALARACGRPAEPGIETSDVSDIPPAHV